MGKTIVDYLHEQRSSFLDSGLNDVDSLILSSVAYFNFEHGVLGRTVPTERVPLPVAICGMSRAELFGDTWLTRMGGDALLGALLESPRFMQLEVGFYAYETSIHFEKQFAAITFFLPDESGYVAFRGTDNSLTGWKEDLNLSFMEEVPSQVSARSYLEDAAGINVERLYVGGHSKGGHLAEYAASTCLERTFARIDRIFNHDGPGFAREPSPRNGESAYSDLLGKTVPTSSVFGMLMENRASFRIVEATGVLFAQHAPTSWTVEGEDFVTASSISPEAAIVGSTINNWVSSYDPDQLELLFNTVFELLDATDASTWAQIGASKSASALAIAEAAAHLPADMRATLASMLGDIAPIMGEVAAQQARSRFA